jgi:serine/threonine-protein kinase
MREALERAFDSKPSPLPPEVPAGAREICERAMARHGRDRYASAAELAGALDDFVVRRGSTRLSEEAALRLEPLRRLAAAPPQSRPSEGAADGQEEIYRVFNECRFGFIQALRSWDGNEQAKQGLQEALELMIEYDLERELPHAAAALLRELPSPRPELATRVEDALRRQRAARERLRALERDVDLSIGERLRGAIIIAVGAVWGLLSIACGIATRSGWHEVTHGEYAALHGLFAVGIGVTSIVSKETLLATAANRRLTLTAILAFAAYTVLWLMAGHAGMTMAQTGLVQSMLGMCMWLTMSFIDRTFVRVATTTALSLAAIVLWPRYFFEWHGLFGGCLTALSTAIWRPGSEG